MDLSKTIVVVQTNVSLLSYFPCPYYSGLGIGYFSQFSYQFDYGRQFHTAFGTLFFTKTLCISCTGFYFVKWIHPKNSSWNSMVWSVTNLIAVFLSGTAYIHAKYSSWYKTSVKLTLTQIKIKLVGAWYHPWDPKLYQARTIYKAGTLAGFSS